MSDYQGPVGPFLELGFYFADRSDADAFADLLAAFVGLGARVRGGCALVGEGARALRFKWALDDAADLDTEVAADQVDRLLEDRNARVHRLEVDGAIGVDPERYEVLTYLMHCSDEALRSDEHVLAVWASGEVFDLAWNSAGDEWAAKAEVAGRRVYERFRAIVERTRPAYAAVTVEQPLPSPSELRQAPAEARRVFHDFFVSAAYVGDAALDRVRDFSDGAFVGTWEGGLYVSRSEEFNPDRIAALPAADVSVEVARLIGAAGAVHA